MVGDGDGSGAMDLQAALRDAQGRWVLDPAGSAVEFHVKHFWGAITVHGHFERVEGEGTVESDGIVSGRLEIEASSLTTKNGRRDQHLRSADFFDVGNHPKVIVSVEDLIPMERSTLSGKIVLEAAGRSHGLDALIDVVEVTSSVVTLRSELVVDRTIYAMTWSPLRMAAREARAIATVRFVRQA